MPVPPGLKELVETAAAMAPPSFADTSSTAATAAEFTAPSEGDAGGVGGTATGFIGPRAPPSSPTSRGVEGSADDNMNEVPMGGPPPFALDAPAPTKANEEGEAMDTSNATGAAAPPAPTCCDVSGTSSAAADAADMGLAPMVGPRPPAKPAARPERGITIARRTT